MEAFCAMLCVYGQDDDWGEVSKKIGGTSMPWSMEANEIDYPNWEEAVTWCERWMMRVKCALGRGGTRCIGWEQEGWWEEQASPSFNRLKGNFLEKSACFDRCQWPWFFAINKVQLDPNVALSSYSLVILHNFVTNWLSSLVACFLQSYGSFCLVVLWLILFNGPMARFL